MAFDPKSVPQDLRPINIARNVNVNVGPTDEPRIAAPTTSGRAPDGYYAGPAMPLYYTDASGVPTLGYVTQGGPGWVPRVSAPMPQLSSPGVSSSGFSHSPSFGTLGSGNGPGGGGGSSDQASEDGGDDSVSGRKVKFMCGMGGKILPRPSDGALRYVGGHTRIVSVRRDVMYPELVQKLLDLYGQPVVIKYQLPFEELDALVSVSCAEDLENMMEEYEKLLETSPDRSAKLRVFLSTASEVDPAVLAQLGGYQDAGVRYMDAVNGITEAGSGGGARLTRKESIASAASTQNSDMSGNEVFDSVVAQDVNGAPSTTMFSPRSDSGASHDNAPRSESATPPLVVPSHSAPAQPGLEQERMVPVHVTGQHQLRGYDLQQMSVNYPPPPSPLLGGYVDPHQDAFSRADYPKFPPQMAFANPQVMGAPRPVLFPPQFRDNAPPVMPQQFIPAIPMTMATAPPHLSMNPNNVQPMVQPQRVVSAPPDQSYGTAYPPQLGGGYGWHQVAQQDHGPFSEGWIPPPQVVPRTADCYMCQKALPHAHSDTVVQDQRVTQLSTVSETNPIYHSLRLDDISRIHPVAPQNQGVTGDGQTHYGGVRGNVAVSSLDDAIQQHSVPSSQPKQELLVSKPFPGENASVAAVPYQVPEASREYSVMTPGSAFGDDRVRSGISQEHVRPVDFMVENVQVRLPDILSGSEQGKSPVGQLTKDDLFEQAQPPILPRETLLNAAFSRPAQVSTLVQEANQAMTSEILPYTALEAPKQHNHHPLEGVQQSNPSTGPTVNQFDGNPSYPPHDVAYTVDRSSPSNAAFSRPAQLSALVQEANQVKTSELSPCTALEAPKQHNHHAIEGVHLIPCTGPAAHQFDGNPLCPAHDVAYTVDRSSSSNAAFSRPAQVSALIQEANQARTSEMLPCTVLEATKQHNNHPLEGVHSNPSTGPAAHQFDGNPSYPARDVAYTVDRSSPSNDLMDDVHRFVPASSGSEMVTSANNVQSAISPHDWGTMVNDSTNSLFSNEDPWNMRPDAHFPPPKPTKITLKRDSSAKELQGGDTNAHPEAHFADGVRPAMEQVQPSKGSAEEQIKQQLQATAEGVAASVLQHSSVLSTGEFTPQETSGSVFETSHEMEGASNSDAFIQTKMEAMTIKPEKANLGFPLSDGMGRLQIIKNNDLEELRELGSGTFGTVYHGKWRGTDVAIKRINERCFATKSSEQEKMRDEFWSEAVKLGDLHHPNVVAFYGVVLDGPDGSVATVTEYMVNGSLRTALQKNERTLDKRKRLLICMDVAFGMEYLHSKNIVHFDLKSDNLLVNLRDPHRPICKVGDLGLSKVKCNTLISGGVRGTLPWMAPELLNGSSNLVSDKVDVFSFGIVLWELLTGEEPYADLHYGAIIGGIVSNTLRPPVPENCDPDWRALMERCWAAEPSERPTFTEIANDLRAMAAKVPPKGQTTNTKTNA